MRELTFYEKLLKEEADLKKQESELLTKLEAVRNLINVYKDCPSNKIEASEAELPEEEYDNSRWHENRKQIRLEYMKLKDHIGSLEKNQEYFAIDEIKIKLNISSYNHAYYYEKLKKEKIVTPTGRGKFMLHGSDTSIVKPFTINTDMPLSNSIGILPEPEINEDESIQKNVYRYITELYRGNDYLKSDIRAKFENCSETNFSAVMKRLIEEDLIIDGENNRMLKFNPEYDKDNYFVVDEEKEKEWRKKQKKLAAKDKPLKEYLK